MERQYYIEGLGCPNCAAKMETQVGKIKGVKSSTVSFVNKKLILEFESGADEENIVNEAIRVMNDIEDNISLINYKEYKKCLEKDVEEEEHDHDHHEECHCHDHEHHHDGECHDHEHHHEDEHDHEEDNDHKGHGDHEHGESSKVSLILLAVGFVMLIIGIILEKTSLLSGTTETIYFGVAYILVAYDVLIRSVKNISKGQIFDEFFLMAVATIGAFAIREYPEAVAVMVFYKVGEYFQDKAVDKARHSIKALVNIKPEYANLVFEGGTKKVNPSNVKVDDIIEIKAGERVPLDGIIIEGSTSLDVSAITGEAKPQDVFEGEAIYSGSINKTGLIKVRVISEFGDSTVARIMEMVENASDKKSNAEQFITKFAKVYTPIVVFLALAIAIIPPFITGDMAFRQWIYKALSFLVVSCPCALVISVPLGFFGGIGVASKNGILVKGGNYLEALADINTIAFDKTGTLTYGTFEVTKVVPFNDASKKDVIRYAAYAESKTNHPISKSILNNYGGDIDEKNIECIEEEAGFGIVASLKDGKVLAGNHKLMDKYGVDYEEANLASTVVYVALDNKYVGYIAISDKIKDTSVKGVADLKHVGVTNTILLSGDTNALVEEVAVEVGINHAYGQLLPGDKLAKIEEVYTEDKDARIAFVGDGINDAPVLARANVGIAMGGVGQDAAIEAADVVIMTDEISKIADAVKIAKFTRQIVTENIIFALGIKVLVLILVVCGMSSMWMAVFADVGVALLAVLNSIRVYRMKIK